MSVKQCFWHESDNIMLIGFWNRVFFLFVYALTNVYAQKHMLLLRMHAGVLLVFASLLQSVKIVHIDDSYRCNTIVSTEYSRCQNSISF